MAYQQKVSGLTDSLLKRQVSNNKLSQLLASGKYDINHSNESCMSAIKAAIISGNESTVQILVESGGELTNELLEFASKSYPHKPKIISYIEKVILTESITSPKRSIEDEYLGL